MSCRVVRAPEAAGLRLPGLQLWPATMVEDALKLIPWAAAQHVTRRHGGNEVDLRSWDERQGPGPKRAQRYDGCELVGDNAQVAQLCGLKLEACGTCSP